MDTNKRTTEVRTHASPGYVAPHTHERRKMSWGAVIAGVLVAVATMILLGLFGAGIGLWAVEPGGETDTIGGMAIGTIIYSVIVQLCALFAGGYVASRMSATWDRQNAILHGVTVWALATIFAIWLTASAAGALFNTSMSVVKNSAAAISKTASAVVPDNLSNFKLPELSIDDLPPEIRQTLREQGITEENLKTEALEAFRSVISQDEQAAIRDEVMATAEDIIRSPGDAVSDIEAAVDKLIGEEGVISQEDRDELMGVIQNRFGISEQEAESIIKKWEARAKEAYNKAKEALVTAAQKTIDAADAATDALASASFWSFVGLLLGLGAAGFGATVGRREHPVEDMDEHRATTTH